MQLSKNHWQLFPSLLAVNWVIFRRVSVLMTKRPNRQDIARLEEDAVALTVDYFRSVDDFKEVDDAKEAREQQKADLEESLAALRREFQTANTEARSTSKEDTCDRRQNLRSQN